MKKSHLLIVGVTTSLALAAVAFAPTLSRTVFGDDDYTSGTWVHYAQKDATKTEKGIREYWIMCGSGSHQFTAPVGVTPVEADTYDTTGFTVDDDRWITPVTVDAQEVVMTDATKALNLGAYSDMTVTSIKSGALNLGTNAANLDVSEFASDHGDDGVREVVAYGVKDGKGYAVFADTTFITKTISTEAEWKGAVIPTAQGTVKGYYKVTADMTVSYTPGWISGWDKCLFGGTIDGGNHKITLGQGSYGQFYVLDHATLKNMTFHNHWWRRTTVNYHLLANKSLDSNFENLTFDVPVVGSNPTDSYFPEANYGYLFGNGGAQRNAFKNCSWDFGNYDLPCLLSHSNNNTHSNTFESCTLSCKSFSELYSVNGGSSIVSANGLSIELTGAEAVVMDRANIDLSATTQSVTLPASYNGLDVVDITITVDGTKHSLGNNLANLQFPQAVKDAKGFHGDTTLKVKYNWDSTKVKNLEVPVTHITKLIATNDDLRTVLAPSTTVTGYYKLANNLNLNSNWTENTTAAVPTFSGTFDGNGKTITSKSRTAGIFGIISNGTIKNVTITDGWCYGGIDQSQSVLSLDMLNSTIENVTITATAHSGRNLPATFALNSQSYGWVNARKCQNITFTDCNFNFGTPSNCNSTQ
mgnify:CR=1 FL=1